MKRYEEQLSRLHREKKDTKNIEKVVEASVNNINDGFRSFIIYGEPQSGKTEMMIALTSKLLDSYEDYRIIIVLLNDNVELLDQNISRFIHSGISPTPLKFTEVIKPFNNLNVRKWLIFAKKNANDLEKLNSKVGKYKYKVIIDDEADYATPNTKVNKEKQSKINDLTGKLIGDEGIYIGVTATPARLDLNRTHNNTNEKWINFEPYKDYKGRDYFFPHNYIDTKPNFLHLMPDERDSKTYLRQTLFNFISNVAYLNYDKESFKQKNYSFLIHASGKKDIHSTDEREVRNIFSAICDNSHKKHNEYIEAIKSVISKKYHSYDIDKMLKYVVDKGERHSVTVMNSDNTKEVDYKHATTPTSPFTVVIGGNVISRGVTFDNLLSMFFTRDVKHKMQQDTYIQRARMFGNRKDYIDHFELHIPQTLYASWNECFFYNRISLGLIKGNNDSPVWIDSENTSAVASGSIKKSAVISISGEIGFGMFDYASIKDEVDNILQDKSQSNKDKLHNLANTIEPDSIPSSMIELMVEDILQNDKSVAIHSGSIDISRRGDDTDKEYIIRQKGFIGSSELKLKVYGDSIHHIFIIHNNDTGMARVYYKMMHSKLRYRKTRR